MTNKIAARDLFYAQVLLSYGDSKDTEQKKIVFAPIRLVYDNQVFSDEAKNGTIFSRKVSKKCIW